MRAVVRSFTSPDIDFDTFWPEDPGDVGFLLQMFVGPADGQGEESFDVMVCTPRWLERKVAEVGPLIGRHYLVISSYDSGIVRQFLRKQVEGQAAEDWAQLAEKIGQIGHWEYEGYRP